MEFSVINGLIKKTASKVKLVGRTDLLHILKQMLDRLHINYTDECCPNSGFSNVRRNNATNKIQYFDYASKVWVDYTP